MADNEIHRIAINTGGGDAPGLNAVIRAAVITALQSRADHPSEMVREHVAWALAAQRH